MEEIGQITETTIVVAKEKEETQAVWKVSALETELRNTKKELRLARARLQQSSKKEKSTATQQNGVNTTCNVNSVINMRELEEKRVQAEERARVCVRKVEQLERELADADEYSAHLLAQIKEFDEMLEELEDVMDEEKGELRAVRAKLDSVERKLKWRDDDLAEQVELKVAAEERLEEALECISELRRDAVENYQVVSAWEKEITTLREQLAVLGRNKAKRRCVTMYKLLLLLCTCVYMCPNIREGRALRDVCVCVVCAREGHSFRFRVYVVRARVYVCTDATEYVRAEGLRTQELFSCTICVACGKKVRKKREKC